MKIRINWQNQANNEFRLSFIFTWMIFMLFLTNVAGVLETITGISYQIISNIGKFSILLLLIFNLRILIQRIKPRETLILIFLLSLITINYIATGEKEYVGNTISSFILTVLPMIIIVISIDNYDILLKQLTLISSPIILFSLVLLFAVGGRINQYSMGLSSSLVIPILVALLNFYYTKKGINLFISIAGIFVIIILGSRGALLGIGVFGIALLLRGIISKENRAKSIVVIVLILILLLSYNLLLEWVVHIMARFGWRSRTLFLLMNDIHHDSGRSFIYESMLKGIAQNPFSINGIAGEYNYTGQYYAHNFILELMCDFGIIIGGFASLFVIGKSINTIWRSVVLQSKADDIKLIMLMSSLPILFVSGSIWKTVYFWTWLFIRDADMHVINNSIMEESLL